MENGSIDDLRQKLNLETARIGWGELQRHYARGVLINVGEGLDLVEVAAYMAADDTDRIRDDGMSMMSASSHSPIVVGISGF